MSLLTSLSTKVMKNSTLKTLSVIISNLNIICCLVESHWSSLRAGVIWSYLLIYVITHTAEFWTYFNFWHSTTIQQGIALIKLGGHRCVYERPCRLQTYELSDFSYMTKLIKSGLIGMHLQQYLKSFLSPGTWRFLEYIWLDMYPQFSIWTQLN